MDLTVMRDKLTIWIKKYKYVLVILLAGILLMLIPAGQDRDDELPASEPEQTKQQLEITEEQLETVLSQIKGAGRVEVLLTLASGEKTVYQTNEQSTYTDNGQNLEHETLILTDSDRSEKALVAQVLGPEYQGAVIVCQGAEDPAVRLAVSEAVSKATGLGTDRISVLKMK